MDTTIAIIGHGYVGQAVEQFFRNHYRIVLYDPPKGHDDRNVVNTADLAIVCVPTPSSGDGSVDLSYIRETFSWLSTPLMLIKSTVPPGTTESLIKEKGWQERLAFSPEYIGEGKYPVPFWKDIPHPTDMAYHSFHIFGGSPAATSAILQFFKKPAGPFARCMQTDATTAELTKYTENAWIATKITFVNELYEIAKAFHVDYDQLRELWLLDGRIGPSHTLVYSDKRGFDGKCIPKDTKGIVAASQRAGYRAAFLESVLAANSAFRGEPPA